MNTKAVAFAALAAAVSAEMYPHGQPGGYPTKWMPKLFEDESLDHKKRACRGRHDRIKGSRGRGKWTDKSYKDPHDKPERFERAKKMWDDEEVWSRMDRREKPRFGERGPPGRKEEYPPAIPIPPPEIIKRFPLMKPKEHRDGDKLWREGKVKERDAYGYGLRRVMVVLKEENWCDETEHDEDDEEIAVNATDVNCTLPEALDDVAERLREIFADEVPEYKDHFEAIGEAMKAAKAGLEALAPALMPMAMGLSSAFGGKGEMEGGGDQTAGFELRKLRWLVKLMAKAKMGMAMHMTKWGPQMRRNREENERYRSLEGERRWRAKGGRGPWNPAMMKEFMMEGPGLGPIKGPHPEMPEMIDEMKKKFHATCAGADDEMMCKKKQWMMWKKWLAREEHVGEWVDVKSKFEERLREEELEGPDAMQASTMLIRCVEAAEPRDHDEEETACIEPYNYTESVLECEEEEPYEADIEEVEGQAPVWVWALVAILLIITAASLMLLFVCRCRGRAAFHRRQTEARLAAKLGIDPKGGAIVGHAISSA